MNEEQLFQEVEPLMNLEIIDQVAIFSHNYYR